ncbi:unnamed protein product [Candidula unifasciata]|uniref:ABC transporter domain-containing protein n=1 Tax=Candidula unifasciata TaxID=100452 RepID=A0A8S3ZFB5_9EUPU|nr:unnamed protein product [Candidula unifasciata]
MKLFSQIGLLMWKNWLLQKRRICVTVFEVILPILFAIIFIVIRLLVKADEVRKVTTYERESIANFSSLKVNGIIGFAPNTSETNALMETVRDMIMNFDTKKGNGEYLWYKENSVLILQNLIGQALTKHWLSKENKDPDSVLFGAYMQRMAYPPYYNDGMILILQNVLPLFLILSFILSVIIGIKNLVYEKERKLKESMKLMGLTSAAHWISWLLTLGVYLVPAMAIYAILFGVKIVSAGAVLNHTDPSLFFVFLLCYSLSIITFCFMISSFVQKANVGAIVGGIVFFAFYFPYYFITNNYDGMSKNSKLGASLLFNCAMSLGANCIGLYEGTGAGARWNNFDKPATPDDNISMLDCMIMLLVDSAIHFLIAWYVDNISPGEFGVPKPFYFCFTKSYWCSSSTSSNDEYENRNKLSKYFEKEPTDKEAGIRICNLKKTFGRKVAVAGTSLNMYKGQITVLLGHNGAGKTTTMSMLTGFIPPTSGTAYVNDYDIRNNIAGVRSSLGLCPQHDILFDTLTVEEHLHFFAKLKGCTSSDIKSQVVEVANEVGLESKIKDLSQNLSGGQKRKLSVGIALIGGSKVVFLDEPSSGMDPGARRQIWNVLQRARQGRTIVLSTHYMDEADLLGDRIAIMAEGVIKCCGSSMFLKKFPSWKQQNLKPLINSEVSYLLPDNMSSRFPDLFNNLDKKKEELGITSFGAAATTMEEVFLKVGDTASFEDESPSSSTDGDFVKHENGYMNGAFEPEKNHLNHLENGTSHGVFGNTNKVYAEKGDLENENLEAPYSDIMAFNKGFSKKTGLALKTSRIRALFVKKAIHTWRNRTVTLVQLLLPVLSTLLGLGIMEAKPENKPQPLLKLDLSAYGRTNIPYTTGVNFSLEKNHFADLYGKQFGQSQNLENFNLSSTLLTFNLQYIIGLEVADAKPNETIAAIAYYNGQPLHSQPISVNYMMNTFLQSSLNDSYSLQSTVHPLPKDEKEAAKDNILSNQGLGFTIGLFITIGMSFLTTLFMYFLIKERQVGAKHMQVVSGVGPITYWLPTFLWDFINYIIPSLLLIVVFAIFSKTAFIGDGRWAIDILILVLYGWAVLPFMYAIQFAFTIPATGVAVVLMINIVTGLVTTIAVFIFQIPTIGLENVAVGLDWLFTIFFPNYNMASCFINMYTNYENTEACKPNLVYCKVMAHPCCKDRCTTICYKFEEEYMSWTKPGIGPYLFFMALQGVVCVVIIILIENHIFQRIWYLIRGAPDTGSEFMDAERSAHQTEDSDVAAERQRINSCPASVLSSSGDPLLLVNLYKRYNNFVAVDHICVGIPEQECFGLLGQNGAGKTTTFKMLTGDVMVTGGNAYLKGFDVRSSIKDVQSNMGYCPQFDALIDQMTGYETLVMYARLRGIPEENISTVVNKLLDILLLRPHADKLAGHYSGGNKRKLSTAIALVGDPPFIMLDEPSSGMDPKARRQLWNVLSQVRASGRTMVLTSHSMEECDALCTRLAIMVNGRFVCLGSPQHLKNKFGQGYTLITQLGVLPDGNSAPNEPVVDFITSHFPGAKVFDDHQGYIHFQVPDATVRLADIFSVMEEAKKRVNVQDYSVHQTTLEQIFLTFTRQQIQPKDEEKKSCKFPFCC